ncbi:beta-aspartyl-peptidase [Shewanella sp. NIFS-20-20]|uniref:beta-aspartyl-peptidase n=1 Tax=Shewanella sp. NIFS-20-20 TaxID=2853806 RepID=UPI001C4651B3|nr:beta-aspartyl-peptidase [Shewanella sp. NIFS-20-20]MBV7316498.1 beta-aspartyl-peptidase [Shewanella sp. NIFS-20-20]
MTSLLLIRNANVYSPEPVGVIDILIGGGKILAMGRDIAIAGQVHQTLNAEGMLVIPGLVDPLVHITGGGGEGGFHTRTRAMELTDASRFGVTTLVAALGTDAVSRSLEDLLAKAKGLTYDGLNVFCYTGSYAYPVVTLTGTITRDLMLIDQVIGIGEIAISDHRGSQLTVNELARVAAEARVGGMLSQKAGTVFVHVGDGRAGIAPLHHVAAQTDIPITQFYPTHMNRSQALLEQGFNFAKAGGVIDFTASTNQACLDSGEVAVVDAVMQALHAGVGIEHMSVSSDGHASLPIFNERGELTGLEMGRIASLYEAFCDLVAAKLPLTDAIKLVSTNAARNLKLSNKGYLGVGQDADLVLMSPDLAIDSVWSRGQALMRDGQPSRYGQFEMR